MTMPLHLSRRAVLAGAAAVALAPGLKAQSREAEPFAERLAALEARSGGQLGIAAFDSGSGKRRSHRGDVRFPLCSTFKFVAAAAVLALVDQGKERLDRQVPFGAADMLDYAPVAQEHLARGSMSVAELCAGAVQLSDNTAGNLQLQIIGGPAALTAWCRSMGDAVTRLDRTEPALNEVADGDPRDTTSPLAMVGLMERLFLSDALKPGSREQLEAWMSGTKTGAGRLPSAIPSGARIGHKTGTGSRGETNDVAIVWPQGGKPVLIGAYYRGSKAAMAEREAVLAEAGRIVFASL
jgi:beta-lactamase class A